MDERLQKALDFTNYRLVLENQKNNLKLASDQNLHVIHSGQKIKITHSLISFLGTLKQEKQKETTLIDAYDNPVKIDNIDELLKSCIEKYNSTMNDWNIQFSKIKKARNMEKLLDASK
jgi:glutamate mutase epsilon subunit